MEDLDVSPGDYHALEVLRVVEIGAILDDGKKGILLPKRYVPDGTEPGDFLEVFIYFDSEDRIIATTEHPKARVNELAVLTVKDATIHGMFLEWGLPKDLFLPRDLMISRPKIGDTCLVRVEIDKKSGRLVANEKVEAFLSNEDMELTALQTVEARVLRKTEMGYVVAVNNQHKGLIYVNEVFTGLEPGQVLEAFVKLVREDGKLDLVPGKPGYQKVEAPVEHIATLLKKHGGYLPYHDKSSPEDIYAFFGFSKKVFKMAIGNLYKAKLITIEPDGIRLASMIGD
jgi:predicted RNA-binding protein (virulence factor B family)